MKNLDMIGKPCPIPVIEAKKALRNMAQGEMLELVVDNDVACQNLEKMAKGLGHDISYQKRDDGNFTVIITLKEAEPLQNEKGSFVVAIGKSQMGEGSEELGTMLMKSYIYALTELDTPPRQLLLYNGGIHLALKNADTLEDLKTLEGKGTQISSCGACLNYYHKTEELGIGTITNMYAIASAMAQAHKLVNL